MLLERFAPACVMIDRKLQVLYVHGAVENYLTFPPGELTTRVVDMAREGLRARLRGGISKCLEVNRSVSVTARVRRGGKSVPVKATVSPLRYPRETDGLLLITFEDYRVASAKLGPQSAGGSDLQQLEDELKVTREELQSTIEQLESSNDQHRASNEEVTAANEELQSANEELETSKEELQSLNEELNTINARLQEKVDELESANNDVVNLLSSTNIATVFLDKDLRVRRYTPAITRLLSLIPSDLGRPVADVLRRFSDESLLDEARRVLEDLTPESKEVPADDGRWYIRRITPYRTQDDRIEGVVITFVDITDLKRSEQALRCAKEEWEQTFNTVPDLVALLDDQHRIVRVNRAMADRLGLTPDQCIGLRCHEAIHGVRQAPAFCPHALTCRDGRQHVAEVHEPKLGGDFLVSTTPRFDQQGRLVGAVHVARDITERKKAEEALRESEEHYRSLFDNMLNGFAHCRMLFEQGRPVDFIFLDVNSAFEALTGLKDVAGKKVSEVIPGLRESDPELFEIYGRVATSGIPEHFETYVEGLGMWFSISVYSPRSEHFVAVFDVITERKEAEEAVRRSREDLNRAQAVAHTGSWRLDVRRNELLWSDENHKIFGIPKGTHMTYETFLGSVHPDDRQYVHEKWSAGLRGEHYDIEHRIVLNDTVKWVREKAELEFDQEGALLGGFGTTQDITELKRAERALRDSEARFRLLSETAGKLLATADPQGIVNELCREVMKHLDCQAFFNFLMDEQTGRLRLNACAGIPGEEVHKLEWLDLGEAVCGCVARDGERIVAESISTTLDPRTELVKSYGIEAYACHPLLAQGRLIGTLSFGTKTRTCFAPEELDLMKTVADEVAIAMDRIRLISELQESRDELEVRVQERTAELQKSNAALAQSNRDLEAFAYVASHDLQEPLRKIQTFSSRLVTLYQALLDDKARDYLERMQRAAQRMQTLVLDLLKYSRITSNPEPFTRFSLRKPVEEAAADLGVLCEETAGRIEVNEVPEVEADRVQMRQLFQNLIANGLKYHGTDKPIIKIYTRSSVSAPFWEICVEDNGIGFDEDYLDRIFKPFQRLHGRSAPYQGTGMGLAICQRIAERHGGSITAESKPGEGSIFIVRLPKEQVKLEEKH
jgi:PAS domain S-box-containing protein